MGGIEPLLFQWGMLSALDLVYPRTSFVLLYTSGFLLPSPVKEFGPIFSISLFSLYVVSLENHIYSYVSLNQIFHPSLRPIHPTAYQIFPLALQNMSKIKLFILSPNPHSPVFLRSANCAHIQTTGRVRTPGFNPETSSPTSYTQPSTKSHPFYPLYHYKQINVFQENNLPYHYALCSRFNYVDETVSSWCIMSQPSGFVLPFTSFGQTLCPLSYSCPYVIYTQSHKDKETSSLFCLLLVSILIARIPIYILFCQFKLLWIVAISSRGKGRVGEGGGIGQIKSSLYIFT